MNVKLLFLCIITQTESLLPAPKRNLQATHRRLLLEQEVVRAQTCSIIHILEACPTKPPKRYSGSREKVRLQTRNDLLKERIAYMRQIAMITTKRIKLAAPNDSHQLY